MQQLEIRLGGIDCNFLFLFLGKLKKENLEKINATSKTKLKHNKRLVAMSVVSESSRPVWVCLCGGITVCLCINAQMHTDLLMWGSRQTKNFKLTKKYSTVTYLYLIVIVIISSQHLVNS